VKQGDDLERLLRPLAPLLLAPMVRRHGDFDACEDAVQEALLAAAVQWPAEGVPENPRAWLVTVASRRLIDELRGDDAAVAARSSPRPRMRPGPPPNANAGARTTTPSPSSSCVATTH
jgi:predicted RNA polymerase sigma factor